MEEVERKTRRDMYKRHEAIHSLTYENPIEIFVPD